jgi:two-component system, NarL family, nitrate/nitrite response regulator NarL
VSETKVAIVSRQPVCRRALAALLSEELGEGAVVEAATLEDLNAGLSFALLMVDPVSQTELADVLVKSASVSARRRLLLAPERDLAVARRARSHGFSGILPKTDEGPLMIAAIRLVLAGGEYFPCFEEAETPRGSAPLGPADHLSKRQRQVLEEMRLGSTNKEIAKTLGISIATVKLHVQAVLGAAGARNRTEAVSRLLKRSDAPEG